MKRLQSLKGTNQEVINQAVGTPCWNVKLQGITEGIIVSHTKSYVTTNIGRWKKESTYLSIEDATLKYIKIQTKFMENNHLDLLTYVQEMSTLIDDNAEYFV